MNDLLHKKLWLPIGMTLFLSGCRNLAMSGTQVLESEPVQLTDLDSISIQIEAVNLSEDMSMVSSKNDELLLMLYQINDSATPGEVVMIKRSVFDANRRVQEFRLPLIHKIASDSLMCFLIEQDTDSPVEQLESAILVHFPSIIQAYQSRDYIALEKYLGDEDLLGVKKIPTRSLGPISIRFRGVHKLDKYDYKVILGECERCIQRTL